MLKILQNCTIHSELKFKYLLHQFESRPVHCVTALDYQLAKLSKRPPMLGYVLTVFFACTLDCGQPAQFTAQTFQTYSQCVAAGGLWLSPNANPDQAVVSYQCDGTTVAVTPTVTPSNPPPVAPPSKPWTAPVADPSGGRGLPVTSPLQPSAPAPVVAAVPSSGPSNTPSMPSSSGSAGRNILTSDETSSALDETR